MKKNTILLNSVLSAMFMAIGLVLPFLTGQIPQIGNMLLPMHIPVLLCGFICGSQYGFIVGCSLPLLRSFLFSAPVLYPTAIAMAFELATYGFLSGYLFKKSRWQCVRSLYRCLIITMIAGRIVWGIAQTFLLLGGAESFSLTAFISGAVLNAIPGIALQLILIPALMLALNKTHLVHFKKHNMKKDKTCEAE